MKYEDPKLTVIEFDVADILTNSWQGNDEDIDIIGG